MLESLYCLVYDSLKSLYYTSIFSFIIILFSFFLPLSLNFKKGDIVKSGTELKFNISRYESSEAFPEAIIDYTEL